MTTDFRANNLLSSRYWPRARLPPDVHAPLSRGAVMPTGSTIALFSLAAIALAVVPGPAVTYIVTQSVDKGRRAGLFCALGVASGGVVHVAAATVGLSALIASSATAFTAVKLVGAAYLIVVGIRRILTRDDEQEPTARARRRPAALSARRCRQHPQSEDGAVLPRVPAPVRRPGSRPVELQVAVLGMMFAAIALFRRVVRVARGCAAGPSTPHGDRRADPPLRHGRHLRRARRHPRPSHDVPRDAPPPPRRRPHRDRGARCGRRRAAAAALARAVSRTSAPPFARRPLSARGAAARVAREARRDGDRRDRAARRCRSPPSQSGRVTRRSPRSVDELDATRRRAADDPRRRRAVP